MMLCNNRTVPVFVAIAFLAVQLAPPAGASPAHPALRARRQAETVAQVQPELRVSTGEAVDWKRWQPSDLNYIHSPYLYQVDEHGRQTGVVAAWNFTTQHYDVVPSERATIEPAITMKLPGTPGLDAATAQAILDDIGAHPERIKPLSAFTSKPGNSYEPNWQARLGRILEQHSPPSFMRRWERRIQAVGQILAGTPVDEIEERWRPHYHGRPVDFAHWNQGALIRDVHVQVVDQGDRTSFGDPLQQGAYELTDFDPGTGTLTVYLAKAFVEKYFEQSERPVTQAVLHGVLEALGWTHQEAALVLAGWNSDNTNTEALSDLHRVILREAEARAVAAEPQALDYFIHLYEVGVPAFSPEAAGVLQGLSRAQEWQQAMRAQYAQTAQAVYNLIKRVNEGQNTVVRFHRLRRLAAASVERRAAQTAEEALARRLVIARHDAEVRLSRERLEELDTKVRGVIGAAFGRGRALAIGPGVEPLERQTKFRSLIERTQAAHARLAQAAEAAGLQHEFQATRMVYLLDDDEPVLLGEDQLDLIGVSGRFPWRRPESPPSSYVKVALIELAIEAMGEEEGMQFLQAWVRNDPSRDAQGLNDGWAQIREYLSGQALAEEEERPLHPFRSDEEAYVTTHGEMLQPLLEAMEKAGSPLSVRTQMFIRGTKVDAIELKESRWSATIRGYLGDAAAPLKHFMMWTVNAQNPWIDFTISTVHTSDRRPLSVQGVRQLFAKDPNVVLIQIPINTRAVIQRIRDILWKALRDQGVDPNLPAAPSASLPTLVQVSASSIPGELKIATFVPTVESLFARLMQLAQDNGIDLKELFERELPVSMPEEAVAIVGAPQPVPTVPPILTKQTAAVPSPLAGLTLSWAQVDESRQTIFVEDPYVAPMRSDLEAIVGRVRWSRRLVRIVVPLESVPERDIPYLLHDFTKDASDIAVTSHLIWRQGTLHRAFLIQPNLRILCNGYGNENVKLARAFETNGFPRVTVAINSLERIERVLHAVGHMAFDVVVTERSPEELRTFEEELWARSVDAFTAQAKNRLQQNIPESERLMKEAAVLFQAAQEGRVAARRWWEAHYKGLMSEALLRGDFDVVVDGSPEKIGARNRRQYYDQAAQRYPQMLFIYQGGEGEEVADVSFNAVTAEFEGIRPEKIQHVRHVSCNTKALNEIVMLMAQGKRVALFVDNTAFRRAKDPGEFKGEIITVRYVAGYHHGPDFLTVVPDEWKPLIAGINTDAAQMGSTTRFHVHALLLRRADGKPLLKREVQWILAMASRVALVDFPRGIFDSTRLTEIVHNLLPQWAVWTPEGANHPLVPMATVWETDDPSEKLILYAVPQESIVIPGSINIVHAKFGLAEKDASLAIVNDAMGVTQLVEGIETLLPVRGLVPGVASDLPDAAPADPVSQTLPELSL